MNNLYFDCSMGIHEEALISSLLGIGASECYITQAVMSLPIPGLRFSLKKEEIQGVTFCSFQIEWDQESEINKTVVWKIWLYQAGLSEKGKRTAERILESYEAGWRGKEASGEDQGKWIRMTVFAAALAACLENLGIWDVIIPFLGEGMGLSMDEAEGSLIPGPKIMRILEGTRLSLHTMSVNRELITPEGAAMAAGIQTLPQLPDRYRIVKFATGGAAGRKRRETGNVRAVLIEEETNSQEVVYRLETNMDDVTGEALGYVMGRLMEAGAGDVHYHSVYMKKNRPGYQLNVICSESLIPVMEQIIFQETTTLGIRRVPMISSRLERMSVSLETSLGPIRAKSCYIPKEDGGRIRRIYPEYASVTEICRKHKKSFQEVYQILMAELPELE